MKRQKKLLVRIAVHVAAVLLFAASSLTAFADAQGTVIPSSAKVRSSADTSSQALMSVKAGQVVTITGQTTGTDGQTWYQIVNGNTTGYMRGDLLRVSGSVEGTGGNEATETQTSANIEPADAGIATVNAASVNVRSGPATSDSVVISAKRGTVMNILGQTTGADGNKWYQVTFNSNGSDVTGYVRSDVVEVSGDPVVAEPAEGMEAPGEDTPASEPDMSAGHSEVSNVLSSRILPLDADLTKMEIDESILEEWTSGNYYLLCVVSKTDAEKVENWYMYDLSKKELKHIDVVAGGEVQSSSGNGKLSSGIKIIMAALAILVIVLIIAVIILSLRLREMSWDEELDEDDDDFYGDDTNDDIEEGRVNSSRWRPRNFVQTSDGEEDDDEDIEEDEDDDEDDELEEYEARLTRRRPEKGAQANAGRPARTQGEQGRPGARPQPGQRAPQRQPQAGQQAGRGPQNAGERTQRAGAVPQGDRRTPAGTAAGQQRPRRQNPAQPQAGGPEREPGRRPAPASASGRAETRRTPAPEERQRNVQPQRPAQKPQPQPAYVEDDDEDDEFEFEFLNMDGKDDL